MKILGENNAPLLDSIAWYSGNSGKDFHFTDGEDSSTWLNKQYDHKKAGTRAVRCKDANPWGLYDMLGNVLEWCEDWSDELMNPYEATPVIDPVPPAKGSLRVRRGGSWASGARYVRAAYRYASPPDNRNGHLGFRLARGLAPSRRGQRS